jgi:hypothetical protein
MKAEYRLIIISLLLLISLATDRVGEVAAGSNSAAITAMVQGNQKHSQRTTTLFAIHRSQTVRLKISGLRDSNRDDPFFRLELSFVDGRGRVISQKVHSLESAAQASVDLQAADFLARGRNSAQLRAVVRFVGTPDTRVTERARISLEILDGQSGESKRLLPFASQAQKVQKV